MNCSSWTYGIFFSLPLRSQMSKWSYVNVVLSYYPSTTKNMLLFSAHPIFSRYFRGFVRLWWLHPLYRWRTTLVQDFVKVWPETPVLPVPVFSVSCPACPRHLYICKYALISLERQRGTTYQGLLDGQHREQKTPRKIWRNSRAGSERQGKSLSNCHTAILTSSIKSGSGLCQDFRLRASSSCL